jgi:hypothetical protein
MRLKSRAAALPDARAFLAAQWRNLVLLNFKVDPAVLAPYIPPQVSLDLYHGHALMSIVGFSFLDARLWGLAIPHYGSFPEVNLRFYVTRRIGGDVRRGVVFIKEIAPHWPVAAIARSLYHEEYVVMPMRSRIELPVGELPVGGVVEYAWRHRARWNRVAARPARTAALPAAGSLSEFIVDHHWGYSRMRDGGCLEYRIARQPWRVAPASDVRWDCDATAIYGARLGEYLQHAPVSAILCPGSPITVFRPQRIA